MNKRKVDYWTNVKRLARYREFESRMLERHKCRLGISTAILYFGGALLVILLMGYGFGWPQIEDPVSGGYSMGPHSDAEDRP